MTAMNAHAINQAGTQMDPNTRLSALKIKIEQGKSERARAEANLETHTKQQQEIVAQMAEIGVTPESVDAEIDRLELEIAENLARAEDLLSPPE